MLNAFIALGIFGTILVFLEGCRALHRLLVPTSKDRAVERLQKWSLSETSAKELDIVRKERLSDIPWLNELLLKARRAQPLRVLHRQADCEAPLGMFVLAMPLLALVGMVTVLWMHLPFFVALLCAVGCGYLPAVYLYWLKSQRMAKFEQQLPEALELVSRALRAGHAFSVGLKLVGDEAAAPVGKEFRRVFDEVSMGVALPEALQNMTERLHSVDLRFCVTSVLIQRETGGNLAEIIDSLAGLIRKRFELQLKVRALSAEGRFSGIILFCLPIVVGLILFKINPDYMSTLVTDPAGKNMLMIGSFMMVMGAIIMKRMVTIKV
jgi:tight adherence protein B